MAGWKKLITAESAANLTQVSASAGFSGSGEVLTFADTALAVGDSIIFRDADDGSDTVGEDCLLIGVKIIYTTDTSTDA